MGKGIFAIVAGIGIIIYNHSGAATRLVIRGTGIDFGYLAIGIGIVLLISSIYRRPTGKQKDNVATFFKASPFTHLQGIKLCNGKAKPTKIGWVQGVLFAGPKSMLFLGWEDVEAMKDGALTAENWEKYKFSDSKSRRVKYKDIDSIQIGGSVMSGRHLSTTLASGDKFSFILAKDFEENPSKKKYQEFVAMLTGIASSLQGKIVSG